MLRATNFYEGLLVSLALASGHSHSHTYSIHMLLSAVDSTSSMNRLPQPSRQRDSWQKPQKLATATRMPCAIPLQETLNLACFIV